MLYGIVSHPIIVSGGQVSDPNPFFLLSLSAIVIEAVWLAVKITVYL